MRLPSCDQAGNKAEPFVSRIFATLSAATSTIVNCDRPLTIFSETRRVPSGDQLAASGNTFVPSRNVVEARQCVAPPSILFRQIDLSPARLVTLVYAIRFPSGDH